MRDTYPNRLNQLPQEIRNLIRTTPDRIATHMVDGRSQVVMADVGASEYANTARDMIGMVAGSALASVAYAIEANGSA